MPRHSMYINAEPNMTLRIIAKQRELFQRGAGRPRKLRLWHAKSRSAQGYFVPQRIGVRTSPSFDGQMSVTKMDSGVIFSPEYATSS